MRGLLDMSKNGQLSHIYGSAAQPSWIFIIIGSYCYMTVIFYWIMPDSFTWYFNQAQCDCFYQWPWYSQTIHLLTQSCSLRHGTLLCLCAGGVGGGQSECGRLGAQCEDRGRSCARAGPTKPAHSRSSRENHSGTGENYRMCVWVWVSESVWGQRKELC